MLSGISFRLWKNIHFFFRFLKRLIKIQIWRKIQTSVTRVFFLLLLRSLGWSFSTSSPILILTNIFFHQYPISFFFAVIIFTRIYFLCSELDSLLWQNFPIQLNSGKSMQFFFFFLFLLFLRPWILLWATGAKHNIQQYKEHKFFNVFIYSLFWSNKFSWFQRLIRMLGIRILFTDSLILDFQKFHCFGKWQKTAPKVLRLKLENYIVGG